MAPIFTTWKRDSAFKEPLIDYFAVALRCHWCRDKAWLEGNGLSPSQEPQRRIGTNDTQPIDMHSYFIRAGTDWPNNIVAMAREAYGHHVAIAPRSSANLSPVQSRKNQSEIPRRAILMKWRQFVMNLDAIDPDRAAAVLTELGAQSITLSDAGDNPVLEPAPGETPLWSDTRVTALFSANTDFEKLREALLHALALAKLPKNYDEVLEDRVWEREWLRDFVPLQFGKRLWVTPTHMAVTAAGATVIELDPGLAFGTGTHATTALCLKWLDGYDLHDKSVLDFGCGSGILAIAAARLGASEVRAVDIDQQALTATRRNAEQNRVADLVSADFDIDEAATFDVVIANILADTLIDRAAALSGHLNPGGMLVLSGILSGQAGMVAGEYRDWINFAAPEFLEEWTLLAGMRR